MGSFGTRYPTHSEAKRYQNVRVWSREGLLQGPAKRQVAHALKNPKLPKSF